MTRMASAASRATRWISSTCAPMVSVASAVCVARFFTSEATTAKPRPVAPARAASMAALSASSRVWFATSVMTVTTLPMRCDAWSRPVTVAVARSAVVDASRAARTDAPTWRSISQADRRRSSVASAMFVTLEVACAAASATRADCAVARSVVRVSPPAASRRLCADRATRSVTVCTASSKSPASSARSAFAPASASAARCIEWVEALIVDALRQKVPTNPWVSTRR
jgi:hypothetical protein